MSDEFQRDLRGENILIVQLDFAMNYNNQHNASYVQSAKYNRTHVTIFTAAVRYQGSWNSYSVVTSSDKYKSTVRVCLLMILKDFIAKHDMNDVD